MRTRREIQALKMQTKKNKVTRKLITNFSAGVALLATVTHVNTDRAADTGEIKVVHAQGKRFTKDEFLGEISTLAQEIAANNDLYASVMIAQAALESGWGNSSLAAAPNYNLFGIKGNYNGNTVVKNTLEDDGSGNYYQIQDGFKRYDNYGQSLQDYADTLTGTNSEWRREFYAGARKSNTNNYQDATAHLTGRYATDTSYASKLNRIIEENGLTRYDLNSAGGSSSSYVSQASANSSVATNGSYTVQSGDGLYGIARRHGMTVDQLRAANGLSGDLIHPGQVLNVTGGQQATSTNPASDSNAVVAVTSVDSLASSASSYSSVAPASVSQGASQAGSGYAVQSGDTLYAISKRYGCSVDQLKAANGISGSTIIVGQNLVIPTATSTPAPTYTESVTYSENLSQATTSNSESDIIYGTADNNYTITITVGASEQFESPAAYATTPVESTTDSYVANAGTSHLVQKGDTLYSLAQRYGADLNTLIANNGGSTNIQVGQVISF